MTTSANEEMKLRKALAGSTTTQTFFSRAEADIALESQGRHAAASKASVVGTEASIRYPRLPADNPFTTDISGIEPPTGYEINAQEPNGTFEEIAASLASSGDAAMTSAEAFHSSRAQAPASGCLPDAGVLSTNANDVPSAKPEDVDGVGGSASGQCAEGSPSMPTLRGAAFISQLRRGRRL
jgi:hypothetical protein